MRKSTYRIIKQSGRSGLIVPSAWVASKYDEALRKFLATETNLACISVAPKKTFKDATVETVVVVFSKDRTKGNNIQIERWDQEPKVSYLLPQEMIETAKQFVFPIYSDLTSSKLIQKIRLKSEFFSDHTNAVWGVKIYQKGKGKPPQRGEESEIKCFHREQKTKSTHKRLLGGSEIIRYFLRWEGMYVDYGIWLAEPRTPEWFEGPRILVRRSRRLKTD